VEAAARAFRLLPGAEITVEANPESASPDKLGDCRRGGANRVSIGVQSFQPALLALMERPHGPEDPARAIEAARAAGIENVSVDLIYGLPDQGEALWQDDLRRALALGTEHISAYLLETDKETPLARRLKAGDLEEPDAETIERLYSVTERWLTDAGFERYEVSNWARPGRESRHNLGYWEDRPYIGFGASSHSYFGGVRSSCAMTASAYVDAVRRGLETRSPLDDGSIEVRLCEAITTAMRLARGADLDRLGARYGVDLWTEYREHLSLMVDRGWAVIAPPRVLLTRSGILWSLEALAGFAPSRSA
jgi:oxygen-independent coproporphyrinogen-3 oxidase